MQRWLVHSFPVLHRPRGGLTDFAGFTHDNYAQVKTRAAI